MDTLELFQRLGLALAIGLLIGTERGWREREGPPGSRAAGIRTYTLAALLGGVWAALVPAWGPWPLALGGVAFGAGFTLFQWREAQAQNNLSVTSVVVGLLTFALGAYAVLGDTAVAVAVAIAAVAVLASREALHTLLRQVTWPELRSAIIILAMTFLLLPVLPDAPVDPWGALNPHRLWLLTILIAAVSFAGHISIRIAGQTGGLLLASGAGALVSSTLVTLNNARLAAGVKSPPSILFAATTIAWCINLVRVLALAATVNPSLLVPLAVPLGAAFAVMALASAFFALRSKGQKSDFACTLKDPFDLKTVLLFGAILAAVTLAAKILESQFQAAGLLPLAAIAGAADVDPVTLSVADLSHSSVGLSEAVLAILVASASNTAVRAALPTAVAGPRFGIPLAIVAALAITAGAVAWLLTGGQNVVP